MPKFHADTKMRRTTVEEDWQAIHEYQARHNCGNFNGITHAALDAKYGHCIHVPGRGFFVPKSKRK